MTTLRGDYIVKEFIHILDEYVETRYGAVSKSAESKAEFATKA
jgi:hypothetical protein